MTGALASLLMGVAVLTLPARPPVRSGSVRRPPRALPPRDRRAVVCAGGCLALGLLLSLPWWSTLVLAAGVGAASRRLPIAVPAARKAAARTELILHLDLLAACLDSGVAPGLALAAVTDLLIDGRAPRPDTDPDPSTLVTLRAVAALLELGADPVQAWSAADDRPELAALAAAARRSAQAGVGWAEAVREQAAELRRAAVLDVEKASARAAVAITAPLCLCFLPAFVCLGLAPVVVGLLGTLGIF